MFPTNSIISTNISTKKGDKKTPVPEITLNEFGIINDVHAGHGNRQVSILGQESLDRFFERTEKKINPGDFAENLTIFGIDLTQAAILDRIAVGEKVLLEITQIGKKCHGDVCAIFREVGQCAMPKEGVFARVVSGGKIKPADSIKYLPRPLKILIITLSDRAFNGIYEDKSGPRIKTLVENFFKDKRWHLEITNIILPDDPQELTKTIEKAISNNVDILLTTGSTGISPRDIAPETILKICEKCIPGIMENIRFKYGEKNPAARLSRSIAGIKNTTQIYTLPGSTRAVEEYLTEIFPTLEHIIYMLHGLDLHK